METFEWILKSRPGFGYPDKNNFELVKRELPGINDSFLRVKNIFISVDPYMRSRMNDAKSYVEPYKLNEPLTGGAVGRVIESKSNDFKVGDLVSHNFGWRNIAQEDAKFFKKLDPIDNIEESVFLGVLGLTGLTAWVGLTEIAGMKKNDNVFISASAGAVGSIAGQIARLLGANLVVGSVGSDEKLKLVTEKYGYDKAINYKLPDFNGTLEKIIPAGIDVYFDNVGGMQLESALLNMNQFGRVALCGMISVYNSQNNNGTHHLDQLIKKEINMRGFTLGNHLENVNKFYQTMIPWIKNKEITFDETVVEGLENTVEAFVGMMQGTNIGKMVIKID